jgi:hypothetical protein
VKTATARRETSGIRALPSPPARPLRPRTALGVVQQVRLALKPRNRLAFGLGAALGSVVPVASYWLAHFEVDRAADLWPQLPAWLVLGGLVFSATTVYGWGRLAFGHGAKAAGFCVLVEGVLLASRTQWLAVVALAYLVAINAVATGCRLARG